MKDLTTRTIRDIAIEMPQTTSGFGSFKIDHSGGGRKIFPDVRPGGSGLFNRLEAFEFARQEHIHTENNILFPRAIELEGSAFPSAH